VRNRLAGGVPDRALGDTVAFDISARTGYAKRIRIALKSKERSR
jgi:hypothetical protein